MKRFLIFVVLMSTMVTVVWADIRTVKLSAPNVTCAICPITVRKALEKVDGVRQAEVAYESKTATVVFGDQKTNAGQLTEATKEAGYPSTQITQE